MILEWLDTVQIGATKAHIGTAKSNVRAEYRIQYSAYERKRKSGYQSDDWIEHRRTQHGLASGNAESLLLPLREGANQNVEQMSVQ